jgi:hypothetical protein
MGLGILSTILAATILYLYYEHYLKNNGATNKDTPIETNNNDNDNDNDNDEEIAKLFFFL